MTTSLPFEVRTFKTRDEWLQERRHGIGGSDVAAMLGLSPYMTPLELYHHKRGEIPTPEREGEWLEWGQALEEPIAQRFARETGRTVLAPWQALGTSPDEPYIVLVDREHPFLRVSLDRFFVDATQARGTLEIKNTSEWKGKAWEETGEIPEDYLLQVEHGLGITRYESGSFAALIGGNRFRYDDIKADEKLIALVRERAAEFWRRVELGDPPPAGSDDKEVLRRLYPADTGETVHLPAEFLAVHEELQAIKERSKSLGEKASELENRLKQAIGAASAGVLPGGVTYTLKTTNRKGYTVAATSYRALRLAKGSAPVGTVLPKEAL